LAATLVFVAAPLIEVVAGMATTARLLSPALYDGRVAEWFKAPVLKTGVPARVPWVRIPPLPPVNCCPMFAIVRKRK
jgi:hypothetical protein